MPKPRKPETAAPPRKRRAEPSAPVAAQGGSVAAFPRSVSGGVPRNVPARSESSLSDRAASRPSPVPTRAAPVGAIVSRRAADHLRSGHLWVYASDVVSVTLPKPEETLLPVADQRGIFLGTALYSPQSQIALRLVSRDALDHAAWLKLFAARLHVCQNASPAPPPHWGQSRRCGARPRSTSSRRPAGDRPASSSRPHPRPAQPAATGRT